MKNPLIIGVTNVLTSVVLFAAGRGGLGDWLWFLAGMGITIEQIGRLRRISSGQPAGSFLGALVRPLARKLLSRPKSLLLTKRNGGDFSPPAMS